MRQSCALAKGGRELRSGMGKAMDYGAMNPQSRGGVSPWILN